MILEGFARLYYKETRLDQITKTIAPHEERIWFGRPDYQGIFFGEEVVHNSMGLRTNKKIEGADLIVFGASPSYGWGVRYSETYSFLLEKRFDNRVTVLNSSNIGYSSYQGKKILKDILARVKPKVVLISYVINDVDRYRFIQNSNSSDSLVKKMSTLERFSYFLNENLVLGKFIRSNFKGREYLPSPGESRVNINDYKSNYIEMIKAARKVGVIPVLMKMPVNLHLNKISTKLRNFLKENKCIHLMNDSKHLFECISKKVSFSESSMLTNEIRKIFAINSSRQTEKYHQILDQIGKEYDVTVIDAVSKFKKSSKYLFLDKKEDPIHPNPLGHEILADLIYKNIKSLYLGDSQ
jgi:lysophospholipase L1-like esterase